MAMVKIGVRQRCDVDWLIWTIGAGFFVASAGVGGIGASVGLRDVSSAGSGACVPEPCAAPDAMPFIVPSST
jgi:hypothetical protein